MASDESNADMEVIIRTQKDGGWVSVLCNGFTHNDILTLAPLMSEINKSDVLATACFDSDLLFLNLINTSDNTDAWLNIGKSPEYKPERKSAVASWKNKVSDFDAFKEAAKVKYVCAEEFLFSACEYLGISPDQFDTEGNGDCEKLFFSSPTAKDIPPTRFVIPQYDLIPCEPEKPSICSVVNKGAPSKGFRVFVHGDFVEKEEITVKDAAISYRSKGEWVDIPFTFEKIQLQSGKWVYHQSFPDFKIPGAVSENLPPKVFSDKEFDRKISLRFVPIGNKRKFLDIKITFMPINNPVEGQCSWLVWAYNSSKREYIEEYNEGWKEFCPENMLNPDEYDLD